MAGLCSRYRGGEEISAAPSLKMVWNCGNLKRCIRRPSAWTVRVQTIAVFVITLFLLLTFPEHRRRTLRARSSLAAHSTCTAERGVYIDGRITCDIGGNMKFLSYQPPGGGWNNQRFAFENAVVIAKLLNRTLVAHPLAPHEEILRLKHTQKVFIGYKVYNLIKSENLLPLSKAIDLKYLSRLLPVKEITTDHHTFLETFRDLHFYKVCHNGFKRLWIDAYPPKESYASWNILRKFTERHRSTVSEIPPYRRACKSELSRYFTNSTQGDKPVWGILDELANRTEDMIYFEEGSLYVRDILFLNKERASAAHKWIMRYIRSAPELVERVQRVVREIGHPFNAIHVRRTDHPSKRLVSQNTWLTRLKEKRALSVTNKLYVATDERNKTWFEPFLQAGYKLMFAEDFPGILELHRMDGAGAQDILGLYEQLICAHAFHFVGSYYSTFTIFIHRLREQVQWKGGFLKKYLSSIIWAGDLFDNG